MKNRWKQWFCCLFAVILALCSLTACGSKKEKGNVSMEDLPFGAVLRDLNTTEIPVEYDSRYFTEEAMTVLSNYFYAIQTEDTDLRAREKGERNVFQDLTFRRYHFADTVHCENILSHSDLCNERNK